MTANFACPHCGASPILIRELVLESMELTGEFFKRQTAVFGYRCLLCRTDLQVESTYTWYGWVVQTASIGVIIGFLILSGGADWVQHLIWRVHWTIGLVALSLAAIAAGGAMFLVLKALGRLTGWRCIRQWLRTMEEGCGSRLKEVRRVAQ